MAVIQVFSLSSSMQKHSGFQLRVRSRKERPSPHSFPLTQRSYDRSAVGDITDAGSYVRNLCWLTGSAATKATWGQKSGKVPRGGRRADWGAANRQEVQGVLLRAETSDPKGGFVYVDN